MPLTGFMQIKGIPGESRRVEHEGEIDVTDVMWRIEQAPPSSAGRGRRRARAEVGDVVVTKTYDSSSPYLALAAMQSRSFPEVVISVRRDSGDAHLDYLTITMSNVLVSQYEIIGTDPEPRAGDEVLELVGLTFEEVRVRYVVQDDDHSAGDEHEIEYDIAAGA